MTHEPREVAYTDQIGAAAAEATETVDRWSADGYAAGYYIEPGAWLSPSASHEWTMDVWRETFEPWIAGGGRTCLHNPNIAAPQPVWAVAWRPGLVVCGECLPMLDLGVTAIEDRTCDRCGKVVAGPEHGEPIVTLSVQVDFMGMRIGACEGCSPEEFGDR